MNLTEQNNHHTTAVITSSNKQSFSVVCRGSWLSLAQASIFKQKVAEKFPTITINVIIKETAGDKNLSTPLYLVEGKDFFTREIQDFLQTGQADFAVHSMKDVSGEEFFKQNHYAVIDRNDLRDVAIFNSNILEKLRGGEKIIIGTSSPRRSNMATAFLQNALPQLGGVAPVVEAIPIRGNVDARLQKLTLASQYDGIILAAAGLNRLLQFEPASATIKQLLSEKKIMVLPLFECPPAAGQGAIVAETVGSNLAAIEILEAIKDEAFHSAIQQERKCASQYGYGCSQQFGAFHINTPSISFTYASGKDIAKKSFTIWDFEAQKEKMEGELFSSTDYMKDFFSYQFLQDCKLNTSPKAVFVSSHKAIHSLDLIHVVSAKRVWAAGTRTWLELAKQGIWVEGSSDGLGLHFAEQAMQQPLINLHPHDIQIVTNTASANNWQAIGYNAVGTYTLIPAINNALKSKIAAADFIFWTSFQQYQLCKTILKSTVKHSCLPGKTVNLLQQEGITPVIFPGIKAFNEWRKINIITTVEG